MNIVFDIGNVLLRWDPRFLFTQYFDDEAEMEWFLAHVCNHEWNLEQDRGRSFAEAVKLAIAQHPDHAEAIAAYDTRWHETLPHAIEGTVAIFKELVERDAPVYAITNWNGDKFREAKQRFPFLYEFRDIVVSGDEKLIKPDPAIYQLLLGRNGLEAADCLFIDDSLKNVKGAEAIGMKAHHFTSPEGLRKILVELDCFSQRCPHPPVGHLLPCKWHGRRRSPSKFCLLRAGLRMGEGGRRPDESPALELRHDGDAGGFELVHVHQGVD